MRKSQLRQIIREEINNLMETIKVDKSGNKITLSKSGNKDIYVDGDRETVKYIIKSLLKIKNDGDMWQSVRMRDGGIFYMERKNNKDSFNIESTAPAKLGPKADVKVVWSNIPITEIDKIIKSLK